MGEQNNLYEAYAKGFFEIAAAEDVAQKIGDELEQISNVLSSNLELKEFFFNKEVDINTRIKALSELFQGKLSKLGLSLIIFLLDKESVAWFDGVKKAYIKQVEERFGVVEVEVTTAYELDNSEINKIENKLQSILKKKTWVRSKVDPSIIGGLKLRIGSKLLDASIKNYLGDLKDSLLKG